MRKIKELTPKAIRDANEQLEMLGAKEAGLPGPQHEALVGLVHDVADTMQLPPPNILVHKGLALATAYSPEHETLAISETLTDILSPDEFRALIAHELDHHAKAHLKPRMDNAAVKLLAKGESKSRVLLAAVQKFSDFIEFSADERAAKLYGADNLSNALQKVMVDGIEKSSGLKHLIFPEAAHDIEKPVSKEQIAERVGAMADGTYEPDGWALKQLLRRFQNLRKERTI